MSIAQRHWAHRASALAILLAVATPATAQLTTNSWLPLGSGYWTNDTNWALTPDVPDSNTEVAIFTNAYTASFSVTQDVNLTINGIIYNDTGGGSLAVMTLRRTGSQALTFDGDGAFISSGTTVSGGAGLDIQVPVVIGDAGVTMVGSGTARFFSPLTGSSTVTVSSGSLEIPAANTNFTGAFVVNGGILDVRNANAYALGSTNVGTFINGTGQVRFRDLNNNLTLASEPITINGFNPNGSLKFYASSNFTFNGPITLNTNGVLVMDHWYPTNLINPGSQKNWIVNSVISDGGNARNVHFYHQLGDASTGAVTRTSEFLVGGVSTYGGFTHITVNRSNDWAGPYSATVRLTNGNDRLPITTTVFLGGITNGVGIAGGNGRFVLNGYNQELAGLVMLGTGTSNRVTGGQPGLSTLTLNIGAGITNRFSGFLGGPDLNDDNLALISRGPGILELSGANTYTGTTTVTNGTLRVNGTHIGGGAYTLLAGGTLGGTGSIDAAVASLTNSFIAPGIDAPGGTLALGSLNLDGTLQIEIGIGGGDLLDVNGIFDITNGVLQLSYSGLTNGAYVFATYDTLAGDSFGSIVGLDGYTIDYSYGGNQIALVIPEPSTLALLALGLTLIGRMMLRRPRRN